MKTTRDTHRRSGSRPTGKHSKPAAADCRTAPTTSDSKPPDAAPSPLSVPLCDFLTHLRVECGLAANTLAAYEDDLRQFFNHLADRSITAPAQISGEHMIDHLRQLRSLDRAGSTVARHLAALRSFGRFLVHFGYTQTDPSEMLERPVTWKRLPQTMHLKHIEKLLAAPDPADRLYLRDIALLELMYATGCRASEIAGISLGDLHPDLQVVKITGKGNKQRIVPVGKPALAAIDKYLHELRPSLLHPDRPTDRLLLTARGTPLDRFVVFQVIRKHARTAGIPRVHPHMLRHTFATHMLGGGADLRVVQELLGHSRITTTQVYTHVDQDRLRAVISRHHPRP